MSPSAINAASPESSAQNRPGGVDDPLYLQRLNLRNSTRADFDSYDTLESVPGAARERPLAIARAAPAVPLQAALSAARAYAATRASSSLIVWHDGRVIEESYFGGGGRGDAILSRSLAKPLATIALGRALALHKLRSLDQPVAGILPEWRADPRRARITMRQMLSMTAGFLPQAVATRPDDILNLSFLHPRHDEYLVHDYPVVDEPGMRYEYNNASYDLVPVLIERATGQRYAQFLSRELLQPLGAAGGTVWVNRPGGTAHGGCCIMVPAQTWLRLGVLLLNDGVWAGRRLLPHGFAAQMATGTAANPYYGLGVFVAGPYIERRAWTHPDRTPRELQVWHSEPYLAGDLFLFDGNGNQVMYIVPSERLVILRTGKSPPRATGATEWDNAFLPNTIIRGVRAAR